MALENDELNQRRAERREEQRFLAKQQKFLRLGILITALTGIPTMLGAMLGFWLGEIGPVGLALSLGFASGAMLYVVFGEILPQAILMYHSKLPAFSAIAGLLIGLFIIYA